MMQCQKKTWNRTENILRVFVLSYLTLSGSVTVKLRSAEQHVSMLGSPADATPLFPFRDVQLCDRKSTSRAGVSRVSSTFLGPSSADRWHRAGRRYLQSGRGKNEDYILKPSAGTVQLQASSLPQSLSARPGSPLHGDGHLGHPVRETVL